MSSRKFTVSPAAQREYRVLGGGPSGADATARQAIERARSARQPDAVHVTKRDDGWAVKTAGRDRAMVIKPTKSEAMDSARSTAANRGARLVEHGRDGKIVRNTKPAR